MENKIKVFESKEIRTVWNAEEEEYYFSVVDVVAVLTDSQDPKQYIKKMRSRDTELASKWGTICTPVEMVGLDGRRRKIQAANTKNILRIIQSIPSPKAEPFKVWLAQVGSERLDEIADPVALHVPNDETLSDMEEGQKILSDSNRKRYDDLAELFK